MAKILNPSFGNSLSDYKYLLLNRHKATVLDNDKLRYNKQIYYLGLHRDEHSSVKFFIEITGKKPVSDTLNSLFKLMHDGVMIRILVTYEIKAKEDLTMIITHAIKFHDNVYLCVIDSISYNDVFHDKKKVAEFLNIIRDVDLVFTKFFIHPTIFLLMNGKIDIYYDKYDNKDGTIIYELVDKHGVECSKGIFKQYTSYSIVYDVKNRDFSLIISGNFKYTKRGKIYIPFDYDVINEPCMISGKSFNLNSADTNMFLTHLNENIYTEDEEYYNRFFKLDDLDRYILGK